MKLLTFAIFDLILIYWPDVLVVAYFQFLYHADLLSDSWHGLFWQQLFAQRIVLTAKIPKVSAIQWKSQPLKTTKQVPVSDKSRQQNIYKLQIQNVAEKQPTSEY